MPFLFQKQHIEGIILIEPRVFHDDRGNFMELFKKSEFKQNGIYEDFVQDNFSFSKKGVLRGLHYQEAPHSQGKLVHCLRGKIIDIAVDIRKNSQTFGQWISFELSENNRKIVYLPPGIAHGFYTKIDNSLVLYKATKEYAPNADKGIIWNDQLLNIDWQLDDKPILSEKDKIHPTFLEYKNRIEHE